uniref:BPL/LPL catalytic domain-containing protein n=1 Tax=Anopheles atroparvus TaxID=41427 RepID=A0AAG5DL44_ANOAO
MAAMVVQRTGSVARSFCRLHVLTSPPQAYLNQQARTLATSTTTFSSTGAASGSGSEGNSPTGHATMSSASKQLSAADIKRIPDGEVRKSVFISQSNDVFTNLALEDWIYRHFDLTHHHILMLWINKPAVVIGRHQNPFAETNVSALERNGIELARRNSGGGAVYHDLGNLNCTFFMPRARYDRKYNLNLMIRALYREYGINAELSDRDDIVLLGKKISGTAAKLGQPNAYHHCTLLVNSNKLHLGASLAKDNVEITSKATASIPSPIKNLVDVNRTVNIQQLLSAVGYEFLRTPATQLTDGGRELLMKQRGFQLINPTDKWFPGITELRQNFAAWDWRLGKTPAFSVQKAIQLKTGTMASGAADQQHQPEMKVKVDVEKALIKSISLVLPNHDEPIPVVSDMVGRPYSEDCFHGITDALKGANTESMQQAMGL